MFKAKHSLTTFSWSEISNCFAAATMEEKDFSSSKGAKVERIAYDEALRKYATGRFMVFQFSE